MPSSLTNTNISDTFVGVLHAEGRQLPAIGQQSIYDGAGNTTSIKLGQANNGITVLGGVTTTGSIILSSTSPNNVYPRAYPRIQFGAVQYNYGNQEYLNSDNTDPIYIERVDVGSDTSQLRINIGDNPSANQDKLSIGFTPNNSGIFNSLLSLNSDGNVVVQLAANSTRPYTRPSNWGGGVTSFDFYSDGGTFGAGVGGALSAYFNKNGDFYGRTYSSTSSIQHKTNITPLENALDIINRLDGVRFNWKDTGKSDIGLIAESVNEVLPEFVIKNEKTNAPQGVDYGKITSVLIEAVKELTKLVIK